MQYFWFYDGEDKLTDDFDLNQERTGQITGTCDSWVMGESRVDVDTDEGPFYTYAPVAEAARIDLAMFAGTTSVLEATFAIARKDWTWKHPTKTAPKYVVTV